MSIMKTKPYYCEEYFTVPDINLLKDNRIAIDELSFINVEKFFASGHLKMIQKYGLAPMRSQNGRTYGHDIWGLFDPFHHPRYELFQIDNEILTRLLV